MANMKLMLAIFLLFQCVLVLTAPHSQGVNFEPVFFEIMPGVVEESPPADSNMKGKSIDIPVLMPKDRKTPDGGKNFPMPLYFPTTSTSNEIVMPGSHTSANGFSLAFTSTPIPTPPSTKKTNGLKCHVKSSLISYKNVCAKLLSGRDCPSISDQWLVLDKNGIPGCESRPCRLDFLSLNGKCVKVGDNSVCGRNEIVYIDFTGQASCDCDQFYIYDQNKKTCLARYEQEYCSYGQFLDVVDKNTGRVECVNNPCHSTNMILNQKNGQCYKKNFIGVCDHQEDSDTQLAFDDELLQVDCMESGLDLRNIFEVPALTSCPTGYRRDYIGRCQAVLKFGHRSPFSYRVPSVHTSRFLNCPEGYTKYPNGQCKKINDILG